MARHTRKPSTSSRSRDASQFEGADNESSASGYDRDHVASVRAAAHETSSQSSSTGPGAHYREQLRPASAAQVSAPSTAADKLRPASSPPGTSAPPDHFSREWPDDRSRQFRISPPSAPQEFGLDSDLRFKGDRSPNNDPEGYKMNFEDRASGSHQSDRKRPSDSSHAKRPPPPPPPAGYGGYPPPPSAAGYYAPQYSRSPHDTSSQTDAYGYPAASPGAPGQHFYPYGSYPPPHAPPPGSSASNPNHPQAGYYAAPYPPPYMSHGGGQFYPPQQPFDGSYPTYPASFEDDRLPQLPPSPNTKKHVDSESQDLSSPRGRRYGSADGSGTIPGEPMGVSTPEKGHGADAAFRSPPNKSKRSPFQASPHIGSYGSFGTMDTPGGTLNAVFSPLEPAFTGFGDDGTPLAFDRDLGTEFETPSNFRRKRKDDASPMTGFMNDLSPIESIMRSPMPNSAPYSEKHPPDSLSSHPKGTVTVSGDRGGNMSRVLGSPTDGSDARPRKLWPSASKNSTSTPSSAVRVELGVGSTSTRRSLEGINSMMQNRPRERPRDLTPSGRSSYAGRPPHPTQNLHLSAPYQGAATPSKETSHRHPTPQSERSAYSHYTHPTHKMGYPTPGDYSYSYPPTYPGSSTKTSSAVKIPPSVGKENASTPSSKKSPCNCKKSKCLKLYCDCFAAERFCKGCNCTDCGNTPESGAIRDKAIKDTKAKNPNAFKQRFGTKVAAGLLSRTGHNMGCKCKKSECLKKYCECFTAGELCGPKCKCVDCQNFAGSQALIDKRRKMKDQKGADLAMRTSQEVWKASSSGSRAAISSSKRRVAGASPPGPPHQHYHPQASPRGPPLPPSSHHRPQYLRPPEMMMGPPGMGYPMPPASYMAPLSGRYPPPHQSSPHKMHTPVPRDGSRQVTPIASAPRTQASRIRFDTVSGKRRRTTPAKTPEETFPYFGRFLPGQPKATALSIFSFLSNDDLENAGLVCKRWASLTKDEELWKFSG